MSLFVDTYTRADGAIGTPETGSSYAVDGTGSSIVVVSNKAEVEVLASHSFETTVVRCVPVSATPDDQSIEADVTFDTGSGNTASGIAVRAADEDNLIALRYLPASFGTSSWQVIVRVAGAENTRASDAVANQIGNTRTLKLTVIGDAVTCEIDGTPNATLDYTLTGGEAAALASGDTGIYQVGTAGETATVDNVVVEDETVGGGGVVLRSYFFTG